MMFVAVFMAIVLIGASVNDASAQLFKKNKEMRLSDEWDPIAVVQVFAQCAAIRDEFYSKGSSRDYINAAVNLAINEKMKDVITADLWVKELLIVYTQKWRKIKKENPQDEARLKMVEYKADHCDRVEELKDIYK